MKKSICLAILLLCLLALLTGCGCKHEETQLKNVVEASCTEAGYSGDEVCLKCEKTVKKGAAVEAVGHTPGDPEDAYAATCFSGGYTGDVYCTVCSELLESGEKISRLPHTPGNGRQYAREARCEEAGYTGDVYCTVCGELLEGGEEIPALEHEAGTVREGGWEATCAREGYTGDILCVNCGKVMEEGEAIPMLEHTPAAEREYASEPTCSSWGYTGDLYCADCGTRLEWGEDIPMLEHTPGERQDVLEATCTEAGYAGDVYCTVCGTRMERGEWTEKAPHTPGEPTNAVAPTCLYDGYTGDSACVVCEAPVSGEAIPRLTHSFTDHVCDACGWMEAGLYIDGNLEFTWQDLLNNGYVTVNERNELTGVVESLYGKLVIEEGVESIGDRLQRATLDTVWLPSSLKKVSDRAFYGNETIREVRLFAPTVIFNWEAFRGCANLEQVILEGNLAEMGSSCFKSCSALTSIELSEGLTRIPDSCFVDCSALQTVTLPSTLQRIDSDAFNGCTALKELALPDGIERIGNAAFSRTGITELVYPAALTELGYYDIYYSENVRALKCADLSATQLTRLNRDTFNGCSNLEVLKLPETMENIDDYSLEDCYKLQALELPDAVSRIGAQNFEWVFRTGEDGRLEIEGPEKNDGTYTGFAVSYIVWPVSLTDGSALAGLPNLETIYYRGTELQWSLTASKDLFPNATVVFNYQGN